VLRASMDYALIQLVAESRHLTQTPAERLLWFKGLIDTCAQRRCSPAFSKRYCVKQEIYNRPRLNVKNALP
jgi:hypothetical protein